MTTRESVSLLHKEGLTDIEISKKTLVSRERVRQLRVKLGLDKNSKFPYMFPCRKCGLDVERASVTGKSSGLCTACLEKRKQKYIYCTCDVCGKITTKRLCDRIRNKQCFCSNQCQGKRIKKNTRPIKITLGTKPTQIIVGTNA